MFLWNTPNVIGGGEKEKLKLSVQLGKIAELVAHEKHVRIGRSYIFNIDYIKEVDRKKKCCTFVKNGELIETPMPLQYIQKLSDEMEERF